MRAAPFIACLLGCVPLAAAQAHGDAEIDRGLLDESAILGLEQASGLVVDRTITNFGAQFARFFSLAWRELPVSAGLEITILERPSARHGSLVWVEHNHRPIVRAFLHAGRAGAIQPVAFAAAEYAAKKLADEALAGLLFDDPDLAKEGL